jgi:hypothetical protein
MGAIEELVEIEQSCLERIRMRADELRRHDPSLTAEAARFEAAKQLPKVLEKYNRVRILLAQQGIPGLPLR